MKLSFSLLAVCSLASLFEAGFAQHPENVIQADSFIELSHQVETDVSTTQLFGSKSSSMMGSSASRVPGMGGVPSGGSAGGAPPPGVPSLQRLIPKVMGGEIRDPNDPFSVLKVEDMEQCKDLQYCWGRGRCLVNLNKLELLESGMRAYSYQCVCEKGFTGRFCQHRYDRLLLWYESAGYYPHPPCCNVCPAQYIRPNSYRHLPLDRQPFNCPPKFDPADNTPSSTSNKDDAMCMPQFAIDDMDDFGPVVNVDPETVPRMGPPDEPQQGQGFKTPEAYHIAPHLPPEFVSYDPSGKFLEVETKFKEAEDPHAFDSFKFMSTQLASQVGNLLGVSSQGSSPSLFSSSRSSGGSSSGGSSFGSFGGSGGTSGRKMSPSQYKAAIRAAIKEAAAKAPLANKLLSGNIPKPEQLQPCCVWCKPGQQALAQKVKDVRQAQMYTNMAWLKKPVAPMEFLEIMVIQNDLHKERERVREFLANDDSIWPDEYIEEAHRLLSVGIGHTHASAFDQAATALKDVPKPDDASETVLLETQTKTKQVLYGAPDFPADERSEFGRRRWRSKSCCSACPTGILNSMTCNTCQPLSVVPVATAIESQNPTRVLEVVNRLAPGAGANGATSGLAGAANSAMGAATSLMGGSAAGGVMSSVGSLFGKSRFAQTALWPFTSSSSSKAPAPLPPTIPGAAPGTVRPGAPGVPATGPTPNPGIPWDQPTPRPGSYSRMRRRLPRNSIRVGEARTRDFAPPCCNFCPSQFWIHVSSAAAGLFDRSFEDKVDDIQANEYKLGVFRQQYMMRYTQKIKV